MHYASDQCDDDLCTVNHSNWGDASKYFEDDSAAHVLDEEYYKDIMRKIDPNWLPHNDYSKLIPYVRYVGAKQDIMKFFVPNKYNGWNTYIQFIELNEQAADVDLKAPEVARLLLWAGNIRVHCPCPAFKFWGMQYIMTQKDAAIIPEVRYPHIRNPGLKGVVCKHLNRTLKVLPFHLGGLATAVKNVRLETAEKAPPVAPEPPTT